MKGNNENEGEAIKEGSGMYRRRKGKQGEQKKRCERRRKTKR